MGFGTKKWRFKVRKVKKWGKVGMGNKIHKSVKCDKKLKVSSEYKYRTEERNTCVNILLAFTGISLEK